MNLDAMKKLVRATRAAHFAAQSLNSETLFGIYADCLDTALAIANEKPDELSDSLTYRLIHNESLPPEKVAELLLVTRA